MQAGDPPGPRDPARPEDGGAGDDGTPDAAGGGEAVAAAGTDEPEPESAPEHEAEPASDPEDEAEDRAADAVGTEEPARDRRRERGLLAWVRRTDWGVWRGRLRIVVFGVVGAAIALALVGRVQARVGPFDTTVGVAPSWSGDTIVRLAPLGAIQLDTHDWPVELELRVDELTLAEAERLAENPALLDRVGEDIESEVRSAVVRLVWRCLLAALVGGVIGTLAVRLTWRSAAAGLGLGSLVVVAAGAGTAATFDTQAVAEPRYSGLLTVAPQAVGDVEDIVARFGQYRAQLTDLVGNIVTLYVAAEGLPTFEPDGSMIRLLHVSDVHLNPAAFDLMGRVTEQFGVDAIVDTGDLVDWGTATEEAVVDEIGRLDVPYVWIRGNHDSRAIQRAVGDQPNATVLDDDVTEVEGVRIWGIGDPRYTPNKEELDDETESEQERAENFAPVAAERLGEHEPPDVDIAMVHDPRMAEAMGGEVPLVLAGHTHHADSERLDEGTLLLTEGSTGGAGLRGLQGEDPEPLTTTVLYIDAETHRLVAYDRITVQGIGEQGATIARTVLPEEPEDGEPAEDGDGEEEGDGDGGGSTTTVTTEGTGTTPTTAEE